MTENDLIGQHEYLTSKELADRLMNFVCGDCGYHVKPYQDACIHKIPDDSGGFKYVLVCPKCASAWSAEQVARSG